MTEQEKAEQKYCSCGDEITSTSVSGVECGICESLKAPIALSEVDAKQVRELQAGRQLDILVEQLVTGKSLLECRTVDDPYEPQFPHPYPMGHDVARHWSNSASAHHALKKWIFEHYPDAKMGQNSKETCWVRSGSYGGTQRPIALDANSFVATCRAALVLWLASQS